MVASTAAGEIQDELHVTPTMSRLPQPLRQRAKPHTLIEFVRRLHARDRLKVTTLVSQLICRRKALLEELPTAPSASLFRVQVHLSQFANIIPACQRSNAATPDDTTVLGPDPEGGSILVVVARRHRIDFGIFTGVTGPKTSKFSHHSANELGYLRIIGRPDAAQGQGIIHRSIDLSSLAAA